ncbi:MAG TPA: hypothetical protein PLK94_00640 [Alphaproteobacteria bacterium]|nr:hypothetical protein [Alphaproteobacteria bacterium]HOO49773.1 hypothetical protein [Alphaproteobacteria bacterium]
MSQGIPVQYKADQEEINRGVRHAVSEFLPKVRPAASLAFAAVSFISHHPVVQAVSVVASFALAASTVRSIVEDVPYWKTPVNRWVQSKPISRAYANFLQRFREPQ